MNIEQCYEDKKEIIENAMSKAISDIFDSIDEDNNYDLSTDEVLEMAYEFIDMYIKS